MIRRGGHEVSVILRVVATVLFILATLVALSDATIAHESALIPAGLACWVGSTLVP